MDEKSTHDPYDNGSPYLQQGMGYLVKTRRGSPSEVPRDHGKYDPEQEDTADVVQGNHSVEIIDEKPPGPEGLDDSHRRRRGGGGRNSPEEKRVGRGKPEKEESGRHDAEGHEELNKGNENDGLAQLPEFYDVKLASDSKGYETQGDLGNDLEGFVHVRRHDSRHRLTHDEPRNDKTGNLGQVYPARQSADKKTHDEENSHGKTGDGGSSDPACSQGAAKIHSYCREVYPRGAILSNNFLHSVPLRIGPVDH